MAIDIDQVLSHMGIQRAKPSVAYLDALLNAWSQSIPWESVSRIARHRDGGEAADHVWWPEQYLESAVEQGTGGTCFESNYALKAVLDDLGFAATLHFCDMPHGSVKDPHSALIVWMDDGTEYLADVGYPVPGALQLVPGKQTSVATPVYTYTATWVADRRWRIDRVSGDFEQHSFTLKSEAVSVDDFRKRMELDHRDDGLFLNEMIIQKVMNSEEILRWSSVKGLVRRTYSQETIVPITDAQRANLPTALSGLFEMDEKVIAAALGQ